MAMQISKNTVVAFDYHLTNDDGQVLDSSREREPLHYLHGHGGIIPGLQTAMEGKSVGDEFSVRVPPEEAYGERSEGLCQQVDRAQFENADGLQVGMRFRVDTEQGPIALTVTEIEDDTVTVDGNHPLAGVALNFEVAVRNIREATDEEIQHGHVHGPGGHQH